MSDPDTASSRLADIARPQHGLFTLQQAVDAGFATTTVNERVDVFRSMLRDILTVNSTLVTERQNARMAELSELNHEQGEATKKISSWAAILFTPTLIASIYGMNFVDMPELHWALGYPFAIALMIALSVVLYLWFRRRNWL